MGLCAALPLSLSLTLVSHQWTIMGLHAALPPLQAHNIDSQVLKNICTVLPLTMLQTTGAKY
jgi:hypothetical protein